MLQLGICDDDIHMLDYLSKLCSGILPEARIKTYKNGAELLGSAVDFDIILMDVNMNGMDGLETVKRLKSQASPEVFRRPAVIFVTAYDNYVYDALDLYAFHYLLKPLDESKFEKILRLAAEECRLNTHEKAVFFHTKSNHLRLYPSQILYVESSLRKVIIYTEKTSFEIYSTMAELETLLGRQFFRCHRGYLVNLEKIKRYSRQSIELNNGACLLLSKTRYSGFVNAYLHFLRREYHELPKK